jgi:hypothetical protein
MVPLRNADERISKLVQFRENIRVRALAKAISDRSSQTDLATVNSAIST